MMHLFYSDGLTRSLVWLVWTGVLFLRVHAADSSISNAPPSLVLTAEGRVDAMRFGAAAWLPAQVNQTLDSKDRLRTGFKSRASVRLADQSVLRLNQLTTIEIQPPVRPKQPSLLDLQVGAAYFYNREQPGETQFRTPQASGAIRGTEFHIEVTDDGKTVVTLLDGEVALRNDLGEVTLAPGEQGIAQAGEPPRKTAVLDAVNIIQWALYYPGIIDVSELGFGPLERETLRASLSAYREGELLKAVSAYPDSRSPASAAERVYQAALALAVGQAADAEKALDDLPADAADARLLAEAVRLVIAAVKLAERPAPMPGPAEARPASWWLGDSYFQQAHARLDAALASARQAAQVSPEFGFAWVRVAELEFGFGRVEEALSALDRGLNLSPRHPEGLALRGFLLAAQNRMDQARAEFDRAIEIDGALGNAWLGRGLTQIRQGRAAAGRQDLQTAATLEPNRAVLRSYLGKAYSNERDWRRAQKELDLAKKLDPNDPTSWLYSALLHQQRNRINDAIADLERSKEANENRRVYRSRFLLDQDQAVRSANLAALYRDAGMVDVSLREASRAVNDDYGNYSAHLFLANSYDQLRDPRRANLRYDTPWLSELLLANLLSPVGAGNLSQNISLQEYSKLFEKDGLGVTSLTEYTSNGDWLERGSQYGTFGNSSYSFDVNYRSDNGQRVNDDVSELVWFSKFKQQLTRQDTLFFQTVYFDYEAGDAAQVYDPRSAGRTQRVEEHQHPTVFAGYHREWQPGSHTLFLAGRLDDELDFRNTDAIVRVVSLAAGKPEGNYNNFGEFSGGSRPISQRLEREIEAYTAELQQIWEQAQHTVIGGVRYQAGEVDATESTSKPTGGFPTYFNSLSNRTSTAAADLQRLSVYGYYQWQIIEPLRLFAGLAYDYMQYPRNIDLMPLTSEELTQDQLAPKAGLIWEILPKTYLRAYYAQALGGMYFDNVVRLEPVQMAGFTQGYRSFIPESVVGLVPGSQFESWGAGLEHQFPTRTYVIAEAEWLNSSAERTWGVFDRVAANQIEAAQTPEQLDFQERSLGVTLNQLVADEWSLGTRYRLTDAELNSRYPAITSGRSDLETRSALHQVELFAIYSLARGFFSQASALFSTQRNAGYLPDRPGDSFWQFHVFAGYRFPRRHAEIRVGLLNLTDRDYMLNPLTLYAELPRERMFTASLKLAF